MGFGLTGLLDPNWGASFTRIFLVTFAELFYRKITCEPIQLVYECQDATIIQNFINKIDSFLQFVEPNENKIEFQQLSSSLAEQKRIPLSTPPESIIAFKQPS